jgi:two-component system sensor histidine kinase KdpD
LGGQVARLHGSDIAGTLLDAAADRGVSTIIIGRTRNRPIAELFNITLAQQLLKHGSQYDLTIISSQGQSDKRNESVISQHGWLDWQEIVLAVLATAVGVGLGMLADRLIGLKDLSMIFIIAVLAVASRARMLASVLTAVLCFLSYDFFFIPPFYTFYIAADQGVYTVLLFLAAALIATRLASKLRSQVLALRAANTHAVALQEMGNKLSTAADLGQVMIAGQAALKHALHAEVWYRIDHLEAEPGSVVLTDKDKVAADWSLQHAQACGRFTDTLTASSWWFLPMSAEKETFGVIALYLPGEPKQLPFEQRRLAEAMVQDIAQAALRTRLVSDLEAARVTSETERLRSALLSSVSHDLRSPLSSMIGSAESLMSYGHAMGEEDRHSLLETIRLEGERLDRYIQNLLDMTRLGHQGLTLSRDWIGVDELIGSATRRLERYMHGTCFNIQIPPALPDLYVHPALIEQALFNVLENAAKFSPPNEAIDVLIHPVQDDQLMIDISDKGPGIPEQERKRIFDMFYSVERGDRGQYGTGLGLTIVRAIVGAHMGKVEALSGNQGQGTTIRITVPVQAKT